jgi:hypothetical protein
MAAEDKPEPTEANPEWMIELSPGWWKVMDEKEIVDVLNTSVQEGKDVVQYVWPNSESPMQVNTYEIDLVRMTQACISDDTRTVHRLRRVTTTGSPWAMGK